MRKPKRPHREASTEMSWWQRQSAAEHCHPGSGCSTPAEPSWCCMEQSWPDPTELCTNCRLMSEINDCFYFTPLSLGLRLPTQVALVLKNQPANVGDITDEGSIPASGRSPGGGHGNPLQYSCLENPMDRGAWWATVHRVARNPTWLKLLNTHT